MLEDVSWSHFFRIRVNCDRKAFNLSIIMYMKSVPDHRAWPITGTLCNYNLLLLDTYAIGMSITCTLYFNVFLMFLHFFIRNENFSHFFDQKEFLRLGLH